MPGTLYVVATPIGNLEDVTLRALRVLRQVRVIAAEDTRRTARLLQHYSISTPTTSLHEHNERQKTPALIERLKTGDSVALVSDAGTPTLSDPGAHLVSAAHAAGIRVEPVPGPVAAIAALSAAGFEPGEVIFVGFPPSRSSDRKKWLARLASEERVVILYEAPHRIEATLREMLEEWGNRTIAVGRELTKSHEELVVQPIQVTLKGPMSREGSTPSSWRPRRQPAWPLAPPRLPVSSWLNSVN
jgi:16S rRNA (cytidine1402-2'-O)-methyltransferase